ncbi:MAG: LTA synthase family protein [Bacteroidota bacterium]|nr:LTA synthase family protein [Bacteroidota bacterium]
MNLISAMQKTAFSDKWKVCLADYFKITLPLLIVFYLLRFFEYFTSGIKLCFAHNVLGVFLRSFFFDTWTWLIYGLLLLVPFILIYLVSAKAGRIFMLVANGLAILGCYGLLVVFSERLVPFDHELFVRAPSESFSTMAEVATGRMHIMFPLFFYLPLYYVFYWFLFRKVELKPFQVWTLTTLSVLSFVFLGFSAPKAKNYEQMQEYYFVANKLHYFTSDSYAFLFKKDAMKARLGDKAEVAKEIEDYQQLNKFQFTDKEYPLLHIDESKNVLKDFFRQSDTIPNIVFVIVESLSRDFSGPDAEATSFTPFLDSLANKSLSWYNCLSNAQGTFGSLPSIVGSLPFGNKGFTLLTEPPEHISLLKILKKNDYNSYYFVGGTVNFDNFGAFMRLQGTDYVSVEFGKKYKMMGGDKEGYSIGYPDDALFRHSFEIMDLIGKQPYVSVYLTLTTHTPFIFDQSAYYGKMFDQELKKRKLSESKKRKLRMYRPMFASFLFTDNCLRNFFNQYKKRPEYKNTIFVITGDHHHGFYPTRNEIDDYNVPLIIYSPMLKKTVRFNSVNSHMNIAPTLLSFLKDSYHLKYSPRYVPWVGDELDTCRTFRNIHHIPFMLTNRNIQDYLYGDYYIGENQLYKLKPGLELQQVEDDGMMTKMAKIRENFKFINAYVCQNNKLYPASENIYDVKYHEIKTFSDPVPKFIRNEEPYDDMIKGFKPPSNFRKILVKTSYQVQFKPSTMEFLPLLTTAINSENNVKELLRSTKDIREFIAVPKNADSWVSYVDEDIYSMKDYPDPRGHTFHIWFNNRYGTKMKIKDLKISFLGFE